MSASAYAIAVVAVMVIFALLTHNDRTRQQRDDLYVKNMRLRKRNRRLRRRLNIAGIVTDTLAMDLADAVRPATDWEPPVSPLRVVKEDRNG